MSSGHIPTRIRSPGGRAELPEAQDRPDRHAGAPGGPDPAQEEGAHAGARGALPTEV